MLVKGDKIILIKSIVGIPVGEVFTITGVTGDGVLMFDSKLGTGAMSLNEFEQYFKKVVEVEKPKRKPWMNWQEFRTNDGKVCLYRHNFKDVEVKRNAIKVRSSCHPDDVFNLQKGFELSVARLNVKQAQKDLRRLMADLETLKQSM